MGTGAKVNIKVKAHLKGHNGGIYSLAKGANSDFYSAAADGWIARWQPNNSEDGELIAQCGEPLYTLCFFKETLYAGSSQGHIFIISPDKTVRRIEAHTKGVFFIKPFESGFISGGGDGKLMVWDFRMNLKKIIQLSHHSLRACVVNSKEISIAGSEGKIFNLNSKMQNTHSFNAHKNSIFCLCKINNQWISGGRDAELRFWENGQLQQYIPAHLLHIHALAVNPKLPIFASTSMDKTTKIWSATGELLKVLNAQKFGGHINSVNSCIWLDENTLVTASDDKTVMVFMLEYGV